MSMKIEFVEKASQPGANMARLCRESGIARQTGYKWLKRFEEGGYEALEEETRRPKGTPFATAEDVVVAIVEARSKHPSWGPRKLVSLLAQTLGEEAPSERTIARVLARFGQIQKRAKRARSVVVERSPEILANASNDVWTLDFKGWWRAKNGERCDPFTVRDARSRFILAIELVRPTKVEVQRVMERLFRRYGVPKAIQCDNGTPFISVTSRGGLSKLSAWWVSLGIKVLRSRLGRPEDNGGHERMHLDMAKELERHPALNFESQRRACQKWRQEFNHVRPHEALGGKVPADVYRAVAERKPTRRHPTYPPEWITRRVSWSGKVIVRGERKFVSHSLVGHVVALQPMTGVRYRIWFYEIDLGILELTSHEVLLSAADRIQSKRAA